METSEGLDQDVKMCFVSLYFHHNDPLFIREAGLLKAQESYLSIREGKEKLVQLSPPWKSLGTKHWYLWDVRHMVPGLCLRDDGVVPLQGLFRFFLFLIFLQVCWRESPLWSGFGWALQWAGGSFHALVYRVHILMRWRFSSSGYITSSKQNCAYW